MLVVLVAAGTASGSADNPVLTGDVGRNDEFVISLVDASGTKVKHLDMGTYTLVVHDRSEHHNFHLKGPGVDVATNIHDVGDQTFTITLADGKYLFDCDPHPDTMKGTFTVGSVSTPGTLAASISGVSKFALGPPSRARTVRDLRPRPLDKRRLPALGTWREALDCGALHRLGQMDDDAPRGEYSFGSARSPKLRRSFTVSG